MKKRTSIILSAALAANVLVYSGGQIASSYAEDRSLNEAVSRLDTRNIKREEILPSILKPGEPEQFVLEIDNYETAVEKLKKDLKEDIALPIFTGSERSALSGKISKGVGVALYRLNEKEVKDKKFVPDNDKLISDSKFTIDSADGKFLLPFKNENLKPGDHLGICVSYSVKDSDGKILNKSYVIDSIYLGINTISVKQGEAIDINKMITGVPEGTKIEVKNNFDTKTPGSKEINLQLTYDNKISNVIVPVIVTGNSAYNVPEESLRTSGKNRFETNIESVKKNFKTGEVQHIIIASGLSFADPLAAGPLAMKMKAPIIFSGKNGLNSSAIEYIKSSGAKNITIVGGVSSVPKHVENQLAGMKISRIAGKNRYETSKEIANIFGASNHLIFTDGRNFADALSATPLAKKINAPIILVKNVNNIPKDVNNYRDAYIIGGKSSVSGYIESQIKNYMPGKKVYRIYGSNRSDTSAQVAKVIKFKSNIITNGNSFSDALSSINMLNKQGSNLLLIGSHKVSDEITKLMDGKTNYIIGGYSTVSKELLGY